YPAREQSFHLAHLTCMELQIQRGQFIITSEEAISIRPDSLKLQLALWICNLLLASRDSGLPEVSVPGLA
ncbi:hypothetical protein, partial [Cronobacter malonaticus]|uniref:hypothetical protein n=1 Tax=Cronobacter malonaticus TaxID=413503 RepID=UPI001F43FE72